MTKSTALLAALSIVAAACAPNGLEAGSDGDPTTTSTDRTVTVNDSTTTSTSQESLDVQSALDDMRDPAFPDPLIDPAEVLSGGPPPDGIPPVDNPFFVSVDEADVYLEDVEPVVVLEVDGDARAYPVQILMWHEIVNDEVGGIPVAVTYCPLCNSAVTYVREVDGTVTTFGTSGRLFNSALVMYDRLSETLWTHYDGRAVIGHFTGERLEPMASPLLAWADFKTAFPDGSVLDRERTGARRDYGRNPYAGYDDPDGTPFLFRGDADDRARLQQRIVGVEVDDVAAGWTLEAVSSEAGLAVTPGNVGATEIVIFWKAGQSTALESALIDEGRDVGSVGVFHTELDGQRLTFEERDGAFVDLETGSEWSITGRAVAGELAGAQLDQLPHVDSFWFAWSSYQPDTTLIER